MSSSEWYIEIKVVKNYPKLAFVLFLEFWYLGIVEYKSRNDVTCKLYILIIFKLYTTGLF
jgi:hypothetical protein